jgi:hypothetical protein
MTAQTPNEVAVRKYEDAYKRSRSMKEMGNFLMTMTVIVTLFFALTGLTVSHRGSDALIFLLLAGFMAMIGLGVGMMIVALGQILRATLDSAVHTSPFLSDQDRIAAMSLVPSPEQQRSWATIGLDPGISAPVPPPAPPRTRDAHSPLAVLFAEREPLIPGDRSEPEGRRRVGRLVRRRWN